MQDPKANLTGLCLFIIFGSMRILLTAFLFMSVFTAHAQQPPFYSISADSTRFTLTLEGATHLASLPLKCIYQEYPNKTGHTATGDSDQVLTPKQLHPSFYGCFDWHSCVHGYWMLARLLKKFPDLPQKAEIEKVFTEN